jgi:hypothetical protein
VPAGYAFAIWGLTYVGLIGFALYQSLPSQRTNQRIARITPHGRRYEELKRAVSFTHAMWLKA